VVVGAVIVDSLVEPRRVLATRRTRPADLAGRWEFPGGKVEPGETAEEALVREVREELDVTLMLSEEILTGAGEAWPISDQLTLRLFEAELFVGTLTPGESHDELQWLGRDELDSVDWLDSDWAAIPVIRGLLAG
jgi:8-oxo-dGTP diphosphatase